MRSTSPQYRMADRLAGGKLAEIIAQGRGDGFSYDEIGRRLYADHGIEVTRQTLANWAESLASAPAEAAS